MTTPEQRAHALRQRAEAQLPDNTTQSFEALQQALHELSVHQLELELQNAELRRTQAELDTAHTLYFDFYDLAPVGYITVNEAGLIQQANQTTGKLLGIARRLLIRQPVHSLILEEDRDIYFLLSRQAAQALEPQSDDIRMQRPDGTPFWANLVVSAAQCDDGASVLRIVLTDVSVRKAAEERIQNLAFYDPLTGLPNRRLLMDRLGRALAAGARHLRNGALLFVDLDDFKTVNDTMGHHLGDLLLTQVALRLSTCIREGDTVARLGGDEFVVMLADLSVSPLDAAAQAETVGEKILATLGLPYHLERQEYRSTASIGITLFGDDAHEGIDAPLKRADLAMYQAKAGGRNALRFFDPQMQAVVSARAALETDLRLALAQGQFLLYYQPQVVDGGRLTGAEALVRWQHPLRGLVLPAEFIPLAEETGLIVPLGQWVLDAACTQLAIWALRPQTAHWKVAVNVSALQFHHPDFVAQVLATLARTGANPRRLKLELTESLLLDAVDDVITKMTALKAAGISFSLDDFGTGYSSLSYLKRLPLDQLKIDQSFVRDLLFDPNDVVIARTIVALAHNLGIDVIAEGVETPQQRDILASLGCNAYQGYYFGRPAPAGALDDFSNKMLPKPA